METTQITTVTPDELVHLISESVTARFKEFSKHSQDNVPKDENDFLTRKQTAELFQVSLVTIHDWSKSGILKVYKMGNRSYYKRSELLETLYNSNRSAL